MTLLLAACLSCLVVMVLTLDERPTHAPDSAYYLALGRGHRVPSPFCYRPLVPWVVGTSDRRWRVATVTGLVAQGVLVAGLTGDARASLLLLALPGGARFSVRCPVLVDPLAMAAAIGLAWVATAMPLAFAVSFLLLGAMRESAPVWAAIYARSWWPLVGLLVFPIARAFLHRPTTAADPVWIQTPWLCLERRRGQWLNPYSMLLPWGVLLPLALLGDWLTTVVVYGVATLPLAIATDTARIQQWAAPALIPAALAAPIPAEWWPVLLALHLCNPYRGA
jgi:hypothetical protein